MKKILLALVITMGILFSWNISVYAFEDILESDYYYKEVAWGAHNGIVNGISENKFGPKLSCTRGQIATFIWRAEGKPKAALEKLSFQDVKKNDYYYDAIVWAVERGILSGYTEKAFAPEDPCTRAQLVTILYRLSDVDEQIKESLKFVDVNKTDYYYKAVVWATDYDIIHGYTDKIFGSEDRVLRCDTVKMLYSYYKLLEKDDFQDTVTPETKPDQNPEERPEIKPEITPEDTPEETPEPTPEETPEPTPEETPEPTPEETPEPTPEEMPEPTPEETPKPTPEEFPWIPPDGNTSIDETEKESEVDLAFPWNQAVAEEVVMVAKSYLEHSEDFKYKAGYGAFNNTYIDQESDKYLIDCSTFLGLVLRGIPYEESRYLTNNIWDNYARIDLYDWADSGLDRDNVRWSYQFGDYYEAAGRTFTDLSSVKPADLLLHYKTDEETGENRIWHVSMVLEIKEDGEVICIHSLYGKANEGVWTFPLTEKRLEKYGAAVAVRPDYRNKSEKYKLVDFKWK